MTQTTFSPVGQWIEDCRDVNSSWRVMVPSNILLYRLGLDSIFEDEGWYDQLLEDYNYRDGTGLTLEELTTQVLEYVEPEVESWDLEALTNLTPLGFEQVMWETGAAWEDLREALEDEGVPEGRLRELESELLDPVEELDPNSTTDAETTL